MLDYLVWIEMAKYILLNGTKNWVDTVTFIKQASNSCFFKFQYRTEQYFLISCRNYAAFSGWYITIIICLSALLMQASRNGNDLWLSYWVDTAALQDHPTSFYLVTILLLILVLCSQT